MAWIQQRLCYDASETREQHFSGILRDLDLVVRNVALMLDCTRKGEFYLSLMWKCVCMDAFFVL